MQHSLQAAHLSYRDIDGVYINHFHFNHVGEIEWLSSSTFFNPTNAKKTKLFIHSSMIAILWNNVLSGGLQFLKGESPPAIIQTYFTIFPIYEKNILPRKSLILKW
ncbi:hypothetical protein [Candidatus Coxiella mudrowiae]|uniref:hypothetical protein n=1 Tax=Candidatus Coxiella mudrowiae TaxID=2054173 RepID=UPI001FD0C3EF|nr:hypothetical protein [Candidatus Coxiella mudrowiae]